MGIRIRSLSGLMNFGIDDCLNAALEIYNWVDSNKAKGDRGIYYAINPGSDTDYSYKAVHGIYSLYSGSAGTGFFLIRLYEITKEQKYLAVARDIAEELIDKTASKSFYTDKLVSAPTSELKVTGWHTGVYSGPLGAGIYLLALYNYVKDERYIEVAGRLADDVIEVSVKDESGYWLTGDADIFSDGGYIPYFIAIYKATKDKRYLDAAREYARHIVAGAKAYEGGGSYYMANDLSLVGMPKDSIYPGFSHGTAGIGFILALLYETDAKEWELEAAVQTADFLTAISDETENGRLIPYLWGGETGEEYAGRYYLGFCHGPAGTSLLYRKLYDITGKEAYLGICEELAHGIINAGAPEYNSWGLWNSLCTCCGTPGLIEYFAEMYEYTGKEEYLEYAKRSAAKVIADSYESDKGRCFYAYWDRTDPRDVQTYTGLYTGASGAGANLLRLYGTIKGVDVTPLWEYGLLR